MRPRVAGATVNELPSAVDLLSRTPSSVGLLLLIFWLKQNIYLEFKCSTHLILVWRVYFILLFIYAEMCVYVVYYFICI